MVKNLHILFIVENETVPGDRRVWAEVRTAHEFGYRVSVICPSAGRIGCKQPSRVDGIRFYRHPRPVEGNGTLSLLIEYANAIFWETILALYIFVTKPFHIIHAANPPDHIFVLAQLFRPFGVKFVFDHHDLTPETYVAKFGRKGFFYKLLLIMERWTMRSAHAIITTNESYKKVAEERGRVATRNIFIVRNGPELLHLPAVEPNEGLRDGFRYLVGYVGAIGRQDQIENLLKIAKHIANDRGRRDIKFIVIGKGPDLPRVAKLAKQMQLDDVVQFTGYIPDRELYATLATVDVCVNPECSNEFTNRSTMIKIMEYMAFSRPIVQFHTIEGEASAGEAAINVCGNSEIDFAEAILGLLDNPEKRRCMGVIGRKRIERELCWETQKPKLLLAYEHVMEEQSNRPGSMIPKFTRPFVPLSLYYLVKPLIPRRLQLWLRRMRCRHILASHNVAWPIDPKANRKPEGWPGWPGGKKFSLVLTHDVEGFKGLDRVRGVMLAEKSLGFRSSFNFVTGDYRVPKELLNHLNREGFEIGVHGLHHNGMMYATLSTFMRHAHGIQRSLIDWNAVGFRSPSMHHNLEWLHSLGVRYDSSTFDTDPFEPQPDGVGTIFPLWIVNREATKAYIELPYTLPQDFTLYVILQEKNIELWKRKLEWIAAQGGMALLITHPDYLCPEGDAAGRDEYPSSFYFDLLKHIRDKYEGQYWQALPAEVSDYFASIYPVALELERKKNGITRRPLRVCMPT